MAVTNKSGWISIVMFLHTYIHYNPSVRITPYFLTLLMLYALILYVSGGTYRLTSTLNDRFLRNFSMAGLFTLRIIARNLLRGSRRRNIFHISFLMTALGYEPRLLPNTLYTRPCRLQITFLHFKNV